MKWMMKKKVAVTLGLLGVMAASLLGSSAFAHDRDRYDRHDRHDGWRNNHSSWNRPNYRYRAPARAGWRSHHYRSHNHRVAYRPGNRWGYDNRYQASRRGWW